ncbi:MAG: hypothetical protein Q9170_005746 [Blastenia crenularia]
MGDCRQLLQLALLLVFSQAALSRYHYQGTFDWPEHRLILDKAFDDAILMSLLASNPASMPIDQANDIYNKYFPQSDKAEIMQVYENIVGGNSHTGAPELSDLTIDLDDTARTCRTPDGRDMWASTDRVWKITICPRFWLNIGNRPRQTCSDLGPVASWAMMIPGASILHEFTHLIFVGGAE